VEEKNKDIVSIDFYDNQLTVIEKEGDAERCALEVEKKPFLYISGEVAEILISYRNLLFPISKGCQEKLY
jgi:hypothetical protein